MAKNHSKFAQIIEKLNSFRHIQSLRKRGHNGINDLLWKRHFNDVWNDVVDIRGFDPRLDVEPHTHAPSWLNFAYWWSKAWADAKYMSPDELGEVKALAIQEVEWLHRHPRGFRVTSSYMNTIMSQLNSAIAVTASQATVKSFIDLMLSRERHHALAECVVRRRTELVDLIADLPSNTLRLIGDVLLRTLEYSRMELTPTGH